MPSSSPSLLGPIVQLVMQFCPASGLDVGCGAGKWGALCREYLDWWGPGATGERRTRIDAVEIWAPYIGALHRAVFDEVWFPWDAGDFLEAPADRIMGPAPPDSWDLILCVDVIEHLAVEKGQRFLEAAMRRCKTPVVSTPMPPSEQGAVFGNEHERDVSRWKQSDFEPFGAVSGIGVGGFWVVKVTAM